MTTVTLGRLEEIISVTKTYIGFRNAESPTDLVERDNADEDLNIAGDRWCEETGDPDEMLEILKWARVAMLKDAMKGPSSE